MSSGTYGPQIPGLPLPSQVTLSSSRLQQLLEHFEQ